MSIRDGAFPYIPVISSIPRYDGMFPMYSVEAQKARVLLVSSSVSTKVRVTYDSEIKHSNPLNSDDALNPANYDFTGGVVDLVATNVEIVQENPTIVDLIVLDQEDGEAYHIKVNNVEDVETERTLDTIYDEYDFLGVGSFPTVQEAVVDSENGWLKIQFSESMGVSAITKNNYQIYPPLVIFEVQSITTNIYRVVTESQIAGCAYVLVLSSLIKDASGNSMDPDHDEVLFVGKDIPELRLLVVKNPNEELNLRIYNFILKSIRDLDQSDGNKFLERFLMGPQEVWNTTNKKIFSIKNLWNVDECPIEGLHYLKKIVGWASDLDHLTDQLDEQQLRRLIRSSVRLWKTRSTESVITDIINFMMARKSKIWNWFEMRWLTGPVDTAEYRQGRDRFLIAFPGTLTRPEYSMILRTVTPSDKELFRMIVRLLRPAGESYYVVYLKLMDDFSIADDNTQWDSFSGTLPPIANEVMTLSDAGKQSVISNASGSEDWSNYVVSLRIKGFGGGPGEAFGIMTYFDEDTDSGYFAGLCIADNYLYVWKIVSGVKTLIGSLNFSTIGITIIDDIWYSLRIQVSPELATNRLVVFLNGEQRLSLNDSTYMIGKVGIRKDSGMTKMLIDTIEVLGLPVDSEVIEQS